MLKNQYLINREYLIQLENEQLIDKISKLEKQLALKEAEIKELRKEFIQIVLNS